jgi:transposase
MHKKADTILNYAKKNDSKEIENNLDSKNNGEITEKRGVYKKYTIDEKLKYLDYLNKGISKKEIYRTYGISEKSLRDWEKQKGKLLEMANKKNRFRLKTEIIHSETTEIEADVCVCVFIEQARGLGISIGSNEIIKEMLRLKPELKEKNYHALNKLVYKLLKRNNYTIRRVAHIAQKVRENTISDLWQFLRTNINIRKELDIYENINKIVNLEETPIWFEMYNKTTIDKIWNKTIKVKTFGSDKERISVLLGILADWEKLPPLIVFQGKPNGTIEKNLKKINWLWIKKFL